MADELAVTPRTNDVYDLALTEMVDGLGMCRACAEEPAIPCELYCRPCKLIGAVLEEMREEQEKGRILAGAIEMPTPAPEPVRPKSKRFEVEVVSGIFVFAFFLTGWYGLRALVAFGIWLARSLQQ